MIHSLRLESPETTGEEFLIAPKRQLQEITANCNAGFPRLAWLCRRGLTINRLVAEAWNTGMSGARSQRGNDWKLLMGVAFEPWAIGSLHGFLQRH